MSENESADRASDAEAAGGSESTDDGEQSGVDASATTDDAASSTSDGGATSSADEESASTADGVEAGDETDRVDEASDPSDPLADRVGEASTERIAGEIAALRERVESLERAVADRDETIEGLESKLKRKQADFQNFKKRQERKREEERQRATEDLVERLLDVRDNLVRALDQEEGSDIRSGVETTLRQFDRVFDAENVRTIDPDPGADVDPGRHEVLMRVESDQEAGTVADLHRPGYEMAEKVLRPAQVTVAEEADDAEEAAEE